MHKRHHDINEYTGLWLIGANFNGIRNEFNEGIKKTNRYYFHNLDKWFTPNDKYYYYKVRDFPKIQEFIERIPCVDKDTGIFSVIEGPLVIPPHRAESNTQLRYHLTIESGKDCVLDTENGSHLHLTGEQFLFDHARYHKVTKNGTARRVVLILDIHRIQL
jgi:aspartyl/asparaginyl beta-hydroxylase (cupin superfamily)